MKTRVSALIKFDSNQYPVIEHVNYDRFRLEDLAAKKLEEMTKDSTGWLKFCILKVMVPAVAVLDFTLIGDPNSSLMDTKEVYFIIKDVTEIMHPTQPRILCCFQDKEAALKYKKRQEKKNRFELYKYYLVTKKVK